MKRMLDQKDIAKLKALLSQVDVDYDNHRIDFNECNVLVGNIIIDGINDKIWIDNLLYLVDQTENPLFPLVDNAGKVLVVNQDENGLEAVSLPSAGTQLYKHSLRFEYKYKNDPVVAYNMRVEFTIYMFNNTVINEDNFALILGDDVPQTDGSLNFIKAIITTNEDNISKVGEAIYLGYYDGQLYASYFDISTGALHTYEAITTSRDISDTYDIRITDTITPL